MGNKNSVVVLKNGEIKNNNTKAVDLKFSNTMICYQLTSGNTYLIKVNEIIYKIQVKKSKFSVVKARNGYDITLIFNCINNEYVSLPLVIRKCRFSWELCLFPNIVFLY